ncbi:hypothetical protein A2U01_0045463 [Trifolium medium]|uniref:Uncharacterized protein n=1 Tax=Trifolium medium TaxID=97028 RepID=A0A392QKR0_9FABA|nr:hypothetical protein [Trifolium medium]
MHCNGGTATCAIDTDMAELRITPPESHGGTETSAIDLPQFQCARVEGGRQQQLHFFFLLRFE